MRFVKIILLCILAAVAYGVVFDQITVRICLECFTVGHPPLFATEDPTLLAIGWGVVATWWVGAILGVPLAFCAQAGAGPKRSAQSLVRPILVLLAAMGAGATDSGRQQLEVPWDEFSPRTVLQATGGVSITTGSDSRLTGGRLHGGPIVLSDETGGGRDGSVRQVDAGGNRGGSSGSRGGTGGGRVVGYGAVSASLTNGGTVEAGEVRILDITGNVLDNTAAGTLRATIASDILVQSLDVTQAGTIEIRPNASVSFPAGLLNQPGATITPLGGALRTMGLTNAIDASIIGTGTLDGSLYNNGQVTLLADLLVLGDVRNHGTITIQHGLLTVTGNLTGSGSIIGGLGG